MEVTGSQFTTIIPAVRGKYAVYDNLSVIHSETPTGICCLFSTCKIAIHQELKSSLAKVSLSYMYIKLEMYKPSQGLEKMKKLSL